MKTLIKSGLTLTILLVLPVLIVHGQWNKIFNFQALMRGISFINKDTGYVCGAYEGPRLMKTTNGGYSWENKTGNFTAQIFSVKFLNASTGFLYCNDNFNPGIYSTADSGATWQFKFFEPPYIWSFFFPTPLVGYAIAGVMEYVDIIKTTDGGLTWTKISSLTTPGLGMGVWDSYFLNTDMGFFVTDEGSVYKTSNGGVNWVKLYHTDSYSLHGVWFTSADNGFVAGSKNDCFGTDCGVLLTTHDGGITWQNTFFDPECQAICFTSADTGYLGCAGFYKTLNGGLTWNRDTCSDDGSVSRICFPTTEIGYAIDQGTFFKRDPDIGVGMPSEKFQGEIKIFPVPARDNLTVSLNLSSPSAFTIELVNDQGTIVVSEKNTEKNTYNIQLNVNLSCIPSGIYVCRVHTETSSLIRKVVLLR